MVSFIEHVADAGDDRAAVVALDAVQVHADVHGHLLVETLTEQRMGDVRPQQDVRIIDYRKP